MPRTIVMTELVVKGQFEYKDKFKILPTPQDAQGSGTILGWPYPCIIEYKNDGKFEEIEQLGMTIPSSFVKNNFSAKILSEIMNILSLFCKHRFFSYGCKKSWFIIKDSTQKATEYKLHNGFEYYEYKIKGDDWLKKYPAIEMVTPEKYYFTDKVTDLKTPYTTLPDTLTILLDKYYNLEENMRFAYLTSANLFNQGVELLENGYSSIAFAVFVSSIENLISFIHKDKLPDICEHCHNRNYHVTNKFKEFMIRYANDTPKFKSYSEEIYNRRSKIMHAGAMFLGEVEPASLSEEDNQKISDESFYRLGLLRIARVSLINWLLAQDG